MSRTVAGLILLSVLAGTAAAADEPLPEGEPALADALAGAGAAFSSGAAAIAGGAGAAASGTADVAATVLAGLWSAAKAVGAGIAAAALAVGTFLAAAGSLLLEGIGAAGRALASLARLVGALLLDLAQLLGRLLGQGAAWAQANPGPAAGAAGGTAAAGGLAWLLRRLAAAGGLAGLYTRLAPSRMLDNEVRSAVYEHVKANPGAHPSGIAQKLGLGWGTVIYHLGKLKQGRLVTSRSAHNRKCFFAIEGDLDAQARTAFAAMSTDKTRHIVEAVRASPGISQKELSERLGISQALASWHVKRLVESGVLTTERAGRSNCLRVAAHVPRAA